MSISRRTVPEITKRRSPAFGFAVSASDVFCDVACENVADFVARSRRLRKMRHIRIGIVVMFFSGIGMEMALARDDLILPGVFFFLTMGFGIARFLQGFSSYYGNCSRCNGSGFVLERRGLRNQFLLSTCAVAFFGVSVWVLINALGFAWWYDVKYWEHVPYYVKAFVLPLSVAIAWVEGMQLMRWIDIKISGSTCQLCNGLGIEPGTEFDFFVEFRKL